MKLATVLKSIAIAAIAAMTFQNATAQSPDRMVGLGVITGGSTGAIEVAYAISPGMHLGVGLGIALISQSVNGGSSTSSNNLTFAPFGRFILKGSKDFKPFLHGQFVVFTGKAGASSVTDTGLELGGGGMYFPTSNVQIFGQINVVTVGFGDNSGTAIGIHSGRVGACWWFN
jgi:hypothetical protein